MSAIIQVSHLSKHFKDFVAVDDLSFSVDSGQVYGFLGQNGAGKSTTIRMLLTLIRPTSGTIELFNMNLERKRSEILRRIGAVIERPDLYKYLSALENLRMFAIMSGIRPTKQQLMQQLEMVGLADRAHSRVKTYSQGMKQRLGIATALIHDPDLIILDEPTNGLDPQGIADIRNLILHLSRDRKKTLLISSHLLAEMELIADSMIIIDKGKKIVEGKITELFDPAETVVSLRTSNDSEAFEKLTGSELKPLVSGNRADGIQMKMHRDMLADVLRKTVALGIDVQSYHSRHSLEDYFLSLTSEREDTKVTKKKTIMGF